MEIDAFEAKNKLAALLDRVEAGEEIVITRHGRPVARLVSTLNAPDRQQGSDAADRIRERARTLKVGFSWKHLKSDRGAGRP